MKKEKDIVQFFNRYSKQMLPEDGEQFMEKLKQNWDLLPVPSAFSGEEHSKENAEWLLAKLKKEYKRSKRDAIISCVFIMIIIAASVAFIRNLGLLEINNMQTVGVLAVVAFASLFFLYCLFPFRSKGLF